MLRKNGYDYKLSHLEMPFDSKLFVGLEDLISSLLLGGLWFLLYISIVFLTVEDTDNVSLLNIVRI